MKTYCRNGDWLGVICVILVLAGGCANQTEQTSQRNLLPDSAKEFFFSLPEDVIDDSKDTFLRTDNLIALSVAGAASIAMNQRADADIADDTENHQTIDGFASESLDILGGPALHFAATGLWYTLSAESGDDLNKQRAWTMMRALSVTGAVTVGLKAARNNKNPNGKDWAWPSGHTSSSFTVASVLDEFYGPKVGIPAYIMASLVGYRMIDEGDHWASDVIFGATLGWVVGHSVAGKNKNLEMAGFRVLPYTVSNSGPVIGVNLVKQF